MSRRRWTAPVGAVVVGAVTVSLGVALRGPIDRAATALGSDYALVAAVGFLALAGGLAALARRGAGPARPDAASGGADSTPRPGSEFDRFVRRSAVSAAVAADGDPVRDRLRTLAVRIAEHESGGTRREARQLVRDGAWTDDPAVAGFLGDPPRRPRARVVAAALLRGETPTQYLARRAARELVDRHGGSR